MTKVEIRDRFWFDKFRFCLHFHVSKLHLLRMWSHTAIDKYAYWTNLRTINYGGSWLIPEQNEQDIYNTKCTLHNLLDFFEDLQNDYKLTISGSTGYFYSNTLNDFELLKHVPGVKISYQRECSVEIPRNSMRVKSAKHDLRTYFRNQFIGSNDKNNLMNFFYAQKDIRLSPGLIEWFNRWTKYNYVAANYFVDHNDTGFLTMLELVAPIKIRKTVSLIRDK